MRITQNLVRKNNVFIPIKITKKNKKKRRRGEETLTLRKIYADKMDEGIEFFVTLYPRIRM